LLARSYRNAKVVAAQVMEAGLLESEIDGFPTWRQDSTLAGIHNFFGFMFADSRFLFKKPRHRPVCSIFSMGLAAPKKYVRQFDFGPFLRN
jgi:hypothetical protein